jgi:hypothetical protein
MSACPSCKAAGYVEGQPCARCGHASASGPALELELDVPKPPPPKPKAPPKKPQEEISLELAVDMNDVRSVPPTSSGMLAPSSHPSSAPRAAIAPLRTMHMAGAPARMPVFESEDEAEARTLAGYGDAPTSAIKAPFYTYKVHKRRKELKAVLAGRREEATLAARRAEDALVALGERSRATAANDPQSARTLLMLKDAEELLRSRDHSLAREQDAHAERLRSIDVRIAGVEAELVAAQGAERKAAEELSEAQTALQRADARMKRAEVELRNQAAARAKVTR